MYCQNVVGWQNFSIEAWNKLNAQCDALGLNEDERKQVMVAAHLEESGIECQEQCFDCLAIVGARRRQTQNL